MYENFPEVLKKKKAWVCRGGKDGKKPINAMTGKGAKAGVPCTWFAFDTAVKYAAEHAQDEVDKIVGIGYEFSENDGIVGIDIDHCLQDGEIFYPDIAELVSSTTSYAEISPSGNGLHIYVLGKWDNDRGNKQKLNDGMAIEVYFEKRYFTVTGNAFKPEEHDSNVLDGQLLLDNIAAKYFPKTEAVQASVHAVKEEDSVFTGDVDKQVENLMENDPYFTMLWNREHGEEDESKTDYVLLVKLLKAFNGDVEKAKAVFLESPYMASKDDKHRAKIFERQDYLERTLEAAKNAYLSNQEVKSDEQLLKFTTNDSGNADRLIYLFGDKFRYCHENGTVYIYQDNYWRKDYNNSISDFAERTYQKYLQIVTGCCEPKVRNKALSLGNEGKKLSMIKAAQNKNKVDIDDFNNHRNLLLVNNGIVNLENGELQEFDREKYITIKVGVDYLEDSPQPKLFLKFIDEICCSDEVLKKYLMRVLGYLVTGETREQIFFIFHGAGANGKSVLVNLLSNILGNQIGELAQDALLEKRSLNQTLIQVMDARIAVVNETNDEDKLNSGLVKAISGGDTIKVRGMYQAHISMKAKFKLLFITNKIPLIDWSDAAMLRRVRIIPFNRIFAPEEQDKTLLDKLLLEKEGILRLLVREAKLYYAEGLPEVPECSKRIVSGLRVEEDPLYSFWSNCVEETDDDADQISASELYDKFSAYCYNNGLEPCNRHIFGRYMSSRCVKRLQLGKTRTNHYVGIRLKE